MPPKRRRFKHQCIRRRGPVKEQTSTRITELLSDEARGQVRGAQYLCAKCAALDVNAMFAPFVDIDCFNSRHQYARHITDFDELSLSNSIIQCSTCSFFRDMKINGEIVDSVQKFSLYALRCPYQIDDNYGTALAAVVLCIAPTQEYSEVDLQEKVSRSVCIAQAKQGALQNPERSPIVRRIDPGKVDFSIIQAWFSSCVSMHAKECQAYLKSKRWPKQLALIDCKNRTITRVPGKPRYAALSYVWGSGTVTRGACVKEGKLPIRLPRTIEDAMRVVGHIGIRYLWIDRYCIDQANAEERHTQIKQMDLIYRHAVITLVDAAGTNPHHGLPGVSTTSRISQPHVLLGQYHLMSSLRDPKDVIRTSPWVRRGWTYQESFFSCRRLIFTNEQISWECRWGTGRESLTGFKHGPIYQMFSTANEAEERPWAITKLLSAYSVRKLTYQDDIIRAFEGIFHSFELHRHPVFNYLGTPIMPALLGKDNGDPAPDERRPSESFAAGLCWSNVGPGERRRQFPSWSWAGWTSMLVDNLIECQTGLRTKGETPVKIFLESPTGALIDFDKFNVSSLSNRKYESLGQFVHVEAWTISLRIEYMPQKSKEAIENWLGWPVGCSGYFGIFKDEEERVEVALRSNTCAGPSGNPAPSFSSLSQRGVPGGEGIVGIILGRSEDVQLSFWADRVFILLVQDTGEFYERVGCIEFGTWYVTTEVIRAWASGEPFMHQYDVLPWELIFREKTRKTIRLG
jgi:hypothetical protein